MNREEKIHQDNYGFLVIRTEKNYVVIEVRK